LDWEKDVEQPIKFKKGDIREDGRLFWKYDGKVCLGRPIWLTPESFAKMENSVKSRNKRHLERYKEEQSKLPPEERNYRGKFIPETGLYFAYVSTSGKAVYKTAEEYKAWIFKLRKTCRNYHSRCKKLPPPSCVVGDRHPTNPNLYVRRIYGHKVFYGTYEEAQRCIKAAQERNIKHKLKNRIKIKERCNELRNERLKHTIDNPELRRKRGDIDPVLGRVFWEYSHCGFERWVSKEKYDEKIAKRRIAHLKRTEKKNKS
jgi:hypothetical protein